MKFPPCLSEAETVQRAIAGANLARFGDGELQICMGGNAAAQLRNPALAAELRTILLNQIKGCLVCLPDPYCGGGKSPKRDNWRKFEQSPITLGKGEFGSAFITRPDTAPWIDTPEFWASVRSLWSGKDVTLVCGNARSLRRDMMEDATSIREVWGTYRDAYGFPKKTPSDERDHPEAARTIDELMEVIGNPGHTVLICLGPTATCLAARLAKKNVHAIDLGHLGMFMRSAGSYRLQPDDLLSPAYRALMVRAHKEMDWAGSGHKQAEAVAQFAEEIGAKSILDYGSGQGLLAKALAEADPPRKVANYDPGLPATAGLPKLAHLVVCSDVLEHVEPGKLGNVMAHLHSLAVTGAYFVIATRECGRKLPDGRPAHLIVESPEWWLAKIEAQGWKHARPPVINPGHSVTTWLLK